MILDLGCGTGATVRALGPRLPVGTEWILVDSDPALLAEAVASAGARGRGLALDLNDLDALPLDGVALVTASALLDLTSATWLERLADRLVAAGYEPILLDNLCNSSAKVVGRLELQLTVILACPSFSPP